MKKIYKTAASRLLKIVLIIAITFAFHSCKKLVEVNAPVTSTNASLVYSSDGTATAVLTGIYTKLNQNGTAITALYTGLSSDELTLFDGITDVTYRAFYENNLLASISGPNFWENNYSNIYVANAAIEGISSSTALTPNVKNRLLGEAKFLRAFLYFYLVNLYGNIPLNTTTNYQENTSRGRTSKEKVYEQIIADLKDSEQLLDSNYINATLISTSERTRPNKFSAKALLARVYLYTGDYTNAEIQATSIITNTAVYDTVALADVFLKNSKETIWSLQPVETGTNSNTAEGKLFILPDIGPSGVNPVYLSAEIMNSFEGNDKRRGEWTKSIMANGETYNYSYKYKIGAEDIGTSEYSVILRLAEQYLIRAESRIMRGNIDGAMTDLNVIRTRAGLSNTNANTKDALIDAIIKERKIELFLEWGHRWLDLKRLNKANDVLGVIKGSNWQTTDQLYPIPEAEMERNPSMKGQQNEGYN